MDPPIGACPILNSTQKGDRSGSDPRRAASHSICAKLTKDSLNPSSRRSRHTGPRTTPRGMRVYNSAAIAGIGRAGLS
jgi:hypothetical protein